MPTFPVRPLIAAAIGTSVLAGGLFFFVLPAVHSAHLRRADEHYAPFRKQALERIEKIRGGVLDPTSRIALIQLQQGDNAVGSGSSDVIKVKADALAPYSGKVVLILDHKRLSLAAEPEITVNGVLQREAVLRDGDVLGLGRLTLLVLRTALSPSIAVHDSAAHAADQAAQFYPPSSEFTFEGQLIPYVLALQPTGNPVASLVSSEGAGLNPTSRTTGAPPVGQPDKPGGTGAAAAPRPALDPATVQTPDGAGTGAAAAAQKTVDRDARSAAVIDSAQRSGAPSTDRDARSAAVIDRAARSPAVIDRAARSPAVNDAPSPSGVCQQPEAEAAARGTSRVPSATAGSAPKTALPTIEMPLGERPTMTVEMAHGDVELHSVGRVSIKLGGTSYALEAFTVHPPHLFLPFTDRTNGQPGGTFAGGRMVEAMMGTNNRVELDFNQAYNLPCGISKLYRCPEIPAQNRLPVEISVGEQAFVKR